MSLGKKGQLVSFIVLILIGFGVFGGVYYLEASNNPLADSVYNFLSSFTGYSRDMLRSPKGIYFLFFPYLATVAIIYGLLMEIGLFRHISGNEKEIIYFLIAGSWALFLIPTGILGAVVVFFYAWNAALAVIIFVLVFIIGAIFWGRKTITTSTTGYKIIQDLYDRRKQIENQQSRLTQDFLANRISRDKYHQKMRVLKEMIDDMNKRIKTLQETPHP